MQPELGRGLFECGVERRFLALSVLFTPFAGARKIGALRLEPHFCLGAIGVFRTTLLWSADTFEGDPGSNWWKSQIKLVPSFSPPMERLQCRKQRMRESQEVASTIDDAYVSHQARRSQMALREAAAATEREQRRAEREAEREARRAARRSARQLRLRKRFRWFAGRAALLLARERQAARPAGRGAERGKGGRQKSGVCSEPLRLVEAVADVCACGWA